MKTKGEVRSIELGDNKVVADIIRKVMPEFGAGGAGFAIHDAEVDHMYEAYMRKRCAYLVCVVDDVIVGGGGIAPLVGGDEDICELKKMYFLPAARGCGLGQALITSCLATARQQGYRRCYLETFNTMTKAMALYERNHFQVIPGPMGSTGHFACDRFYLLNL